MAFWIFLLLVNLIMGFLIGYCFRAANEPVAKNLKRRHRLSAASQLIFRVNIAFATVSKSFPALSGTIQSVLVFELMNHPCQLAAFLSSVSVFGYGAHRMILRAHPERKVIEPMPNFYESAATLGFEQANKPHGFVA